MTKFINKIIVTVALLALSYQTPLLAAPKGLSSVEIDQIVQLAMEKFSVPGMAVGIIRDGKVIHAKGYGIRNIDKKGKVDSETLFSIASTGKAFTAAALALLVDEGKISWDDKVIDHIPDFRLYDPWVTREFNIRDLLIHNSGLGLGAGDLMVWPSQDFSRKEIIANIRHLKPVSSFRTQFAYDNLLYLVAGEVIAAVSGMSYEDFIDSRILKPLKMEHCVANVQATQDQKNIADPHMVKNGKLQTMNRYVKFGEEVVISAAGGLLCSTESMLKWFDMHLRKGQLPGGGIFLSEEQQTEIMTPQTIMPVSKSTADSFNTNFSAYGLGWFLTDMNGFKIAQHGGGLPGMLCLNLMIPDLGIGIVIYTNQQAGYARPAIMNTIVEAYTSDNKTDWLTKYYDIKQQRLAMAAKAMPDMTELNYEPAESISRYVGTYKDPWFGEIVITENKGELFFRAVKSERLTGKMVPYKSDIFIAKWNDRTLDADAYVKFSVGYDGNPQGITMKAVSPLTDFSFDFHDLNFERVSQPTP